MRANRLAERPGVREQRERLAHFLAAPTDRVERLDVLGQLQEDAADLLVDGCGEEGQRFGARILGREGRVGRAGSEDGVHRSRDLSEPLQAREESLGLRHELVERELPAVHRAEHVLLQHAERRVERLADVRVPAAELRDVLETSLGQETQEFQLGIDAGLEPPEHLEDQLLVEDDRRVRLLARDQARRRELRPERCEAFERTELEHAFACADSRAAPDHVDELAHVTWIGERVEVFPAREQLIRLVRAGVEDDFHELNLQLWLDFVQRRCVEHVRLRDLARLRREPAPRRDEVDQSFLSWNQKNPLGARVRR